MTPLRVHTDAPALDARELRWATEELAALIRQCEYGSVVCTVLQQSLSELTSLKASAEGAFYGPMRTNIAA